MLQVHDITLLKHRLADLRATLVIQIGNNLSDPRNGLMNAMYEEEVKLSGIPPESLTIFQERRVLLKGLRLSYMAAELLKGTLPWDVVAEELSGGKRTQTLH